MSPLRVADAAHIVPYPHTVGPHGQITPIPLDNAGRNPKLKPTKKPAATARKTRDNEGVNMHVISPRKQPVSRETRPAPTTQRDRDDDEISIPDYPPPSFLEAISTPPLSLCPSTTTLPRPSTPSPLSATMPEPQSPLTPTDSVADSDGSLEIIDMATVPVSNEPIRRRSRWRSATAPTLPTSQPEAEGSRRALLDSHIDETELAPLPNRARHLSLSPFRLLAQKPASPSTSIAPYRSTSFFKSTTSIATSHNASSLRLSPPRSESPLGRKLFTKGKERSRSRETLESWEVLESEQAPPSLLSAVEYVTSPPSSPTSPSPISPVPANTDRIPSASTESLSPTTPRARRAPPPPPPPRRSGARSPTHSPVSDPFAQTPEPSATGPSTSSSPTYQRAPSPDISPTQPVLSTMRPSKPYVHRLSTSPIPTASPSTSATPTRHHYLGRPLPPRPAGPPPPQEPIQLVSSSRCPEGILIDLDDHTPVSQPASRSPTTEVTDFDVLLSRLEYDDAGAQSGANYDALLLVSEILGPGPPCSLPPAPSVASGLVSVERRRVMKDGRVKLKLVLMGTAVDRCGICLTQFREGDCGVVGEKCRHSFHQRCIVRWLARSRTCPMCREAWG